MAIQPAEALDPNLLQSAKKPKGDSATSGVNTRKKRVMKVLAYFGFFFSSLVLFTVVKIPDAAIGNFLLAQAHRASPAHQFQADKISVKFFPLPHLEVEKLLMEPREPGGAIPFTFDELSIYPNPFVLGASFTAEAYKASFKGAGSQGSFRVESDSVDLARLLPLSEIGLDLKGLLTALYVRLAMSNQRLSTANGEIRLKGKNVFFDPSAFVSGMGMTIPTLNLGDLDVEAQVTNGQVKIEKFKIGGAGRDVEIQIPSGTVTLADVMLNTKYDITLHIKPSPTAEKSIPAFAMVSAMGNKRPDGFISIRLSGSMMSVPPQITKGN